jgi:phage minor structural protein
MIKLFGATDTTFATNGDLVIIPTFANVHKEDNGEFYLELETDIEYVEELTSGRIIVANTPQGDQAFRISSADLTRSKIKIKALHLFYDSANYLIKDSYVQGKNCNYAIDHLNDATDRESPFTVWSDVSTIASYRCVRTSLCEAIQNVIERWGGHLVRDNWTINIYNTIGADNGVTVRYKKNLKEISVCY